MMITVGVHQTGCKLVSQHQLPESRSQNMHVERMNYREGWNEETVNGNLEY